MGYGYPALPPDPVAAWEEEQKKREREMMEALRISESSTMPNPGSITERGPQNEYLDRYAEHVRSMPRSEDYKPSTLRKILATIAGTVSGSPQLARGISWNKYDTAMGEWQRERDALKDVADIGEEARRTDVTELGQRRSMEEGRLGREFQGAESEQDRQARAAEADVQREFTRGESVEDRKFREEQNNLDRQIQRERNKMMENYYGAMGNREAQLTPAQQLDNMRLAAFRVSQLNPKYERFMDEKGMPIMNYSSFFGFGNTDAQDEAEYAEFIRLVEEEAQRMYDESMRTTRRDVAPVGRRPYSGR